MSEPTPSRVHVDSLATGGPKTKEKPMDVSTAAWDGAPSRFTDSEWEASCVLDRGGDAPAKERCSLPVREPDGTLNRQALASAAAALHGGRTQVKATPAQQAAAQRKLDSLYSQAGLTVSTKKSDTELERIVPIWKDEAQRLVYGVVLSPGIEDSQGDIVGPEEIQKAAHSYLVASRKSDVQHAEVTTNFDGVPIADVVESFIAPSDMQIAGENVLKGSWVMGMRVNDDATWQKVCKGELTGYSIGGSGVRIPAAA